MCKHVSYASIAGPPGIRIKDALASMQHEQPSQSSESGRIRVVRFANNTTKQALIQIIQNMSCIQIIQNMSCDVVFDFPTQCRFPLSSFYVFAPEIVLGSDEVGP